MSVKRLCINKKLPSVNDVNFNKPSLPFMAAKSSPCQPIPNQYVWPPGMPPRQKNTCDPQGAKGKR